MEKNLFGFGLVGILSLGLFGASAYGMETNEKGFEVPIKDNRNIVDIGTFRAKDASGKEVRGKSIVHIDGNRTIYENIFNRKIESYTVLDEEDPKNNYLIQDKNCDGIFETKYDEKDDDRDIIIPDCYFKQ